MPGELKTLREAHLRVMDLYLRGRTPVEIARETGYSSASVRNITSSQLFQHQAGLRRAEGERTGLVASREESERMNSILRENAELAEKQIVRIMLESESDGVRLNAAKEVLDRAYGRREEAAAVTVMEKGSVQVLIQTLKECGEPALLEQIATSVSRTTGSATGLQDEEVGGADLPPFDVLESPAGHPGEFLDADLIRALMEEPVSA